MRVLALLLFLSIGLAAQPISPDEILSRVAQVHGNPGIFAVAGFRMGEKALSELGLKRGTFSLNVTHYTPLEVQYSCVADGWQAATGVSAGKLNLHVVEAVEIETLVEDRKTSQRLLFRLRPEFVKKYLNTPYGDQARGAREVAELPDEEIFTFSR